MMKQMTDGQRALHEIAMDEARARAFIAKMAQLMERDESRGVLAILCFAAGLAVGLTVQ